MLVIASRANVVWILGGGGGGGEVVKSCKVHLFIKSWFLKNFTTFMKIPLWKHGKCSSKASKRCLWACMLPNIASLLLTTLCRHARMQALELATVYCHSSNQPIPDFVKENRAIWLQRQSPDVMFWILKLICKNFIYYRSLYWIELCYSEQWTRHSWRQLEHGPRTIIKWLVISDTMFGRNLCMMVTSLSKTTIMQRK
jgi:hypothetical protein